MARARARIDSILPQGWLDATRQVLLFAIAYYSYSLVRGLTSDHVAVTAAFSHARGIVNLERGLGLFFEPHLQRWALGRSWLVQGSNWVYLNSQFVVTTAFLAWLYFTRNRWFYYVRNMFMIAMGLALVAYMMFPTAPPRLLPEWGFTDTVTNWIGPSSETAVSFLYNPYAAVPSMHVAFALMVAVPSMMLIRNRLLKLLWAAYPLLITIAVIVTANHFWFDAAVGVLVAATSAYAAHAALARARPEAWSWRRSTLGAKAAA